MNRRVIMILAGAVSMVFWLGVVLTDVAIVTASEQDRLPSWTGPLALLITLGCLFFMLLMTARSKALVRLQRQVVASNAHDPESLTILSTRLDGLGIALGTLGQSRFRGKYFVITIKNRELRLLRRPKDPIPFARFGTAQIAEVLLHEPESDKHGRPRIDLVVENGSGAVVVPLFSIRRHRGAQGFTLAIERSRAIREGIDLWLRAGTLEDV